MSITEETRREGHEAIDKAKRQAMILGCLHGRQIAYELGFSDLNAVKPRLTELRKAGRVKAVGKQKDPLTGVSVAVYEVVERCWKTVT